MADLRWPEHRTPHILALQYITVSRNWLSDGRSLAMRYGRRMVETRSHARTCLFELIVGAIYMHGGCNLCVSFNFCQVLFNLLYFVICIYVLKVLFNLFYFVICIYVLKVLFNILYSVDEKWLLILSILWYVFCQVPWIYIFCYVIWYPSDYIKIRVK